MKISKAQISDAINLTHLTIRSKGHWDYSEEQIKKWIEDLTITAAYINENEVYKLSSENKLIGYYSYYLVEKGIVKMDNLFIDPNYIGKGYGKFLMEDFFQRVKNDGIEKIVLDADPNAEQFYSKLGFKIIGQLASSVKDRFLPIMELEIKSIIK